jgi:dolichyl-phosphate beta-glucosyltransferase
LALVVPCYNEEKKLSISEYRAFLNQNPNSFFCFINDGSTDETDIILKKISAEFQRNTYVLSLTKNIGKGNAVREGVHYILHNISTITIGYLDADLATPFNEILRLHNILISRSELDFVFGSRILTLGSTIKRKRSRHLIGRVIATCISWILNAKIYDTQCGAKVMTKQCAEYVFEKPFLSRWLFDVEIIQRIKTKNNGLEKILEEPLKHWEDKGKSSVRLSYGFLVWWDLLRIKFKG